VTGRLPAVPGSKSASAACASGLRLDSPACSLLSADSPDCCRGPCTPAAHFWCKPKYFSCSEGEEAETAPEGDLTGSGGVLEGFCKGCVVPLF
jgi:hypothetical protein